MSQEHDVFEAIARLVADGEYRDWRTQTRGQARAAASIA